MFECFLTNLYSVDVMAPFCLEMRRRGYDCHLALDEFFWKVSYGEHFNIDKALKKANEWGVELKLRLNYDVDVAISQWRANWGLFSLYRNLKAKMSYGIGLNKKTNFAGNDFEFDYYFVHGDFEKDNLIKNHIEKDRIVKIGFPKLKHQSVNFAVIKRKPTITYLPTWDEYKCIDLAINKLSPLKENYEIYFKPHPLQSQEDLEQLEKFFIPLSKDVTLKSVVFFSDVIIGDLKSGALFDALYFDPMITLIALSKKRHLQYHYSLYRGLDSVVCETDELELLPPKNKSDLRRYCFCEEFKIKKVSKISRTNEESELEVLKERLEKTYKEWYR